MRLASVISENTAGVWECWSYREEMLPYCGNAEYFSEKHWEYSVYCNAQILSKKYWITSTEYLHGSLIPHNNMLAGLWMISRGGGGDDQRRWQAGRVIAWHLIRYHTHYTGSWGCDKYRATDNVYSKRVCKYLVPLARVRSVIAWVYNSKIISRDAAPVLLPSF